MEIMDQVIQNWLEKDTGDINEYCNGVRVEPKAELTVKEDEVETPFNRFYNDENLIIDFGGGYKTVVK